MPNPATWRVRFYQDERGRRPVEIWLDELDKQDRARVQRALELLTTYGTQLTMPYARHLRGKLWELRIKASGDAYRVIYAAVVERQFILLHAFAKKTAKTPARELEMAERRLSDYQARQKESKHEARK